MIALKLGVYLGAITFLRILFTEFSKTIFTPSFANTMLN